MRNLHDEVEVDIPYFPGFYESHLAHLVDWEIERMFDYDGCGTSEEPEVFWREVDYRQTHENVAKLWLEAYQCWLKGEHDLDIPLKWSAMQSPKEYNFTTDRVFALVRLNDMAKAFRKAGTEAVKQAARDRFTSYDGFCSFYNNDIREWGKLSEWDCNQLGTIFAAIGDRNDLCLLMEDWNCNGEFEEAIVMSEKGRQMVNDYYEDHRKLEEWNTLSKI